MLRQTHIQRWRATAGHRWRRWVTRVSGGCNPDSWWYRRLERKVPGYVLPDALSLEGGGAVTSASTWSHVRRPELLALFRREMYGRDPGLDGGIRYETVSEQADALDGKAVRREVRVHASADGQERTLDLLLYLPATSVGTKTRVPVFLGLNFFGNHTVHDDPGVSLTRSWVPNNSVTQGRPPGDLRGLQASSWQVSRIVARGYGLATVYCGDLVPDRSDALAAARGEESARPVGGQPPPDRPGAVSWWAWGLSRAMDYLAQDPGVDATRTAVMGHSRLGKAALWAGAVDERFALVISNQSGCCGAALSRRRFSETIAVVNRVNPHWFCPRFQAYNEREDALPFDQHQLIALMAPRPVYVSSAQLDLNADPMGEFLGTWHAGPVYRLFGAAGLPVDRLPPVNTPVRGRLGYHLRSGGHAVTAYDWDRFMDFADAHLRGLRDDGGRTMAAGPTG